MSLVTLPSVVGPGRGGVSPAGPLFPLVPLPGSGGRETPSRGASSPMMALVHMSPLLLLAAVPFAYGIFGVRRARLRSPIHFQQGTLGASPWRAAVSMCLLSLPPFAVAGMLESSASALFYLMGAFAALIVVIFTSSNILHYIPSPSVYTYLTLRFHSKHLRRCLSSTALLFSLCVASLLLLLLAAALASLTGLPIAAAAPLIAFSCLFSVIFSGQSNLLSPVFIASLVILTVGLGVFVYFGIEDVASLQVLIPARFSAPAAVFSFTLGCTLTMYQLVASPAVYQLYFSLPTRHKLRLCFALYGVFLLIGAAFVFMLSALFSDFLGRHCQLHYSFSSLFQFIKYTLHPHAPLAYLVTASFLLVPLLVLQQLLLSTTGHFWEEFARPRFVEFSAGKQLVAVQVTTFGLALLLTLIVSAVDYARLPLHLLLAIGFYILSSVACVVGGVFLLGHYLPFANAKGSLAAIAFSLLLLLALSLLHISANELPEFEVMCAYGPHRWELQRGQQGGPKTSSSPPTAPLPAAAGHLFARAASAVARLPLYTHPFIVTVLNNEKHNFLNGLSIEAFVTVTAAVSWMTGGEDLFMLDWNLVVYVCTPFSPPLGKRRSFVESESFRYAQQSGANMNVRYPTERRILYA